MSNFLSSYFEKEGKLLRRSGGDDQLMKLRAALTADKRPTSLERNGVLPPDYAIQALGRVVASAQNVNEQLMAIGESARDNTVVVVNFRTGQRMQPDGIPGVVDLRTVQESSTRQSPQTQHLTGA